MTPLQSARSNKSNPAPDSKQPLADIAYEAIKQKIITLKYEPGTYLNEASISEQFGIGRTPVHHAVKRLTLEGMVEVIPRKGLIVKPISLKDVMDVIDVRRVNEPYCVRLATERATDAEIEELKDILARTEISVKARDTENQMLLDRDFHCAISQAARNQVLAEILSNLHYRSLRLWFISLNDQQHAFDVGSEHADILKHIKARDADKAEASMGAHIEAFRRNVSRYI